jgi:hypothetical protein
LLVVFQGGSDTGDPYSPAHQPFKCQRTNCIFYHFASEDPNLDSLLPSHFTSANLMKSESNLFQFNIKSWKCKTKSNHKFLTIHVFWNHKLLSFEFSHQKIQTNKLHPTNPFGIHTSLSSSRFPKAEKKMSWSDQWKLWNLPAPQWQHLQTAWLSQEYLHPVQCKKIAPNINTFIRLPKNQRIIPFFNFPQ